MIKFRGKDKRGIWRYGYYVVLPYDKSEGHVIYEKRKGIVFPYHIDPSTLGIFTGLTDRNDIEIYGKVEGGRGSKIMFTRKQGYGWTHVRGQIDEIVFVSNRNYCGFVCLKYQNPFTAKKAEECEVITEEVKDENN